MLPNFPTLRILPVKDMVVHEWHDDQRTHPLVESLHASGILRNPPIVIPLEDGTNRHMVLDGANRTTALQKMKVPHVLAQVIEPEAPNLELKTWNHVLWGYRTNNFLQDLTRVQDLKFEALDTQIGMHQVKNDQILAWIQTPSNKAYIAYINTPEPAERLKYLNAIVDSYKNHAAMDRTRVRKIEALNGLYNELCALVIFSPFKTREVLQLCSAGYLFPTGITRFTVSPRALRVNYPLEELAANKSLEEKNQTLDQWLQTRLAHKGVRFYAEPTILYDE